TDGAELFGRGDSALCRIISARDIESLDWGELPEKFGNSRGPDGRTWHRFAWRADGSWLAINLDQNRRTLRPTAGAGRGYDLDFSPICRGAMDTQGRSGQNPVIALSFTELLERMLGQSGTPYWLDPQFTGYGDAEQYTRRDRV